MIKIAIVLIAFLAVGFIDALNFDYQWHYFIASCFYFSMFLITFKSKSELLYIYSYVNVIVLATCVNMMLPKGFHAIEYFVYDAMLNLSSAVICYELLILLSGIYNVFVDHRDRIACFLLSHNN